MEFEVLAWDGCRSRAYTPVRRRCHVAVGGSPGSCRATNTHRPEDRKPHAGELVVVAARRARRGMAVRKMLSCNRSGRQPRAQIAREPVPTMVRGLGAAACATATIASDLRRGDALARVPSGL